MLNARIPAMGTNEWAAGGSFAGSWRIDASPVIDARDTSGGLNTLSTWHCYADLNDWNGRITGSLTGLWEMVSGTLQGTVVDGVLRGEMEISNWTEAFSRDARTAKSRPAVSIQVPLAPDRKQAQGIAVFDHGRDGRAYYTVRMSRIRR